MSQLHVICKIGESEYALPGNEVFQVESFTTPTPVPGSPSYVLGLVQIRQQIMPVLDLRLRFGFSRIAPTLESRIIVLRIKERLVAMLVDSAREVQMISPELFKAPPDVIAKQTSGFVKSVAQLKNRIVMLLDSDKVVGEDVVNG